MKETEMDLMRATKQRKREKMYKLSHKRQHKLTQRPQTTHVWFVVVLAFKRAVRCTSAVFSLETIAG